jgi:isopenicillin N synthase-like dioxygenase
MNDGEIPTIDLERFFTGTRREKLLVAREWNHTFETMAFAKIVGHGIPLALMDAVQSEARSFFALPTKQKMLSTYPGQAREQGYMAVGDETVSRSKGYDSTFDLCESLTFPYLNWEKSEITYALDRSIYRPNLWPEEPSRLRELSLEYSEHTHRVILCLMSISALVLGLPEDHFERYFDRMLMFLRFTNYPEQRQLPKANQYRYGPHTDYLGFTILLPEDVPGGLQVLRPDGSWQEIHPARGELVINTGDLIARWTNDRWKSNIHRVGNPDRAVAPRSRRLSVVMFTGPNADAAISSLPTCVDTDGPSRYETTTTWEYLVQKMEATLRNAASNG